MNEWTLIARPGARRKCNGVLCNIGRTHRWRSFYSIPTKGDYAVGHSLRSRIGSILGTRPPVKIPHCEGNLKKGR